MNGDHGNGLTLLALLRPRYTLPAVAILVLLYVTVLHPWLMAWGATPEEQRMTLPGDDLVPTPAAQSTRAITINAPAPVVWQWLVQVGQDRGGFYSYDWLENLTGADIHTTDAIRPAWQERPTGAVVPLIPRGYLGTPPDFGPTAITDPGRSLVLTGWGAFVLMPIDAETTRLVVRDRAPSASPLDTLIGHPLFFTMEAREMRGIKARAEGTPHPPALLAIPARIGWAAAGVVALALFLTQRGLRRLWLLLPLVAALPALALGHDGDAALAALLAVGITMLGALRFGRRWWGPFPLLAAAVMLTLLLAPDAYLVFGWAFLVVIVGATAVLRRNRRAALAFPGGQFVHRAGAAR